MDESKQKAIEWLASGDTGMSSKALAFEFLGADYEDSYSIPIDPSDLGRCLRLIDKVPKVRGSVDSLAKKHESWAKIAPAWDMLADSMREEVGIDWSKGKRAPITYRAMNPYTHW